MRICFPAAEIEATLDSKLERVLGNAKSYLIYDTAKETYEVIPNFPDDDSNCKLALYLDDYDLDVVISCELCISCFDIFESLDIDLWKCDGSINIRESYQKFIIGGIFHRIKPDVCSCPHEHELSASEIKRTA